MVGIEKLPLAGLQTNTLIANLCTLACVGPFGMMLLYGIPAAPPQWMVLALFNGISNIVQGHAMCDLYNDASNLIVVAYMLKNAKMLARLRYRYGRTIICYVLQMIADCVWWILLFGDGYDTYSAWAMFTKIVLMCLISFHTAKSDKEPCQTYSMGTFITSVVFIIVLTQTICWADFLNWFV